MPHLKFRGLEKQLLVENSKELIDSLANIIKCDRNWLTIEHNGNEYIFDGKFVSGPIIIDVSWFDRGQETKDLVAKYLTEFCKRFVKDTEIIVVFHSYEKISYYDNGEHF